MAMASEFMNLNASELNAKEQELRRKKMDLRFDLALGKLVNTAQIGATKRDLARLLTAKNALRAKAQ
jgi:large subunit ribosomal protein L29